MTVNQSNLIGGHPCLDFMNTVGDHLSDEPGEGLNHYADLVLWGEVAGVISRDQAARLIRLAAAQPDQASEALVRAITLRETIYRLLLAAIRHESPAVPDLTDFNQALAGAPARTGVRYDGHEYGWRLSDASDSLDVVLWGVLWSAADLLTSDRLERVSLCAGDVCGWLFLDTSRNHSRRWCSMSDCGNRAKANRFYQRHKSEE